MRLRFRSWIILTLEIFIPTIIIIAIGGVKNAVGNSTYNQVIKPPLYQHLDNIAIH